MFMSVKHSGKWYLIYISLCFEQHSVFSCWRTEYTPALLSDDLWPPEDGVQDTGERSGPADQFFLYNTYKI